jgi:alkaline phosphatase D
MTQIRIDRRGALGLIGAAGALPSAALAATEAKDVAFRHGVASGDPTPRGAILWTRVTTANADVPVRWSVAESEGGRAIESGTAQARAARDWTVKVEPKRLKPGREYWYWFEASGVRSPVGRFRTLPEGSLDQLVLALASCQLYGNGYFNAYAAIAQEPALDAVLFLGDYIYEYEPFDYGGENARKLNRVVEPDHEIVSLADYRARHASYKSDPDLQAAHARAAWIVVWDDHEVANDGWLSGADNHTPATEGDWGKRKAAAMQAYFEWMPIRDPQAGKPPEAIERSFRFGNLATVLMMESRLLARDEQADAKFKPTDAASIAKTIAERNRPERELIGEAQRGWIERELTRSVAAGEPWQVVGSQVVMARVPGPELDKLFGAQAAAAMLAALPAQIAEQVRRNDAGFKAGLPYNLDSWDGYPAARERLYQSFRKAGSHPLVVSGDSHAFWANSLKDDAGTLVASEFGTSAITSPSVGDHLPQVPLGMLLEKAAPEVDLCDQSAKGYIRLTLTPAKAAADYVAVPIATKTAAPKTIARFERPAKAPTTPIKRIA